MTNGQRKARTRKIRRAGRKGVAASRYARMGRVEYGGVDCYEVSWLTRRNNGTKLAREKLASVGTNAVGAARGEKETGEGRGGGWRTPARS